MRRLPVVPRPGWQETIRSQGLVYSSAPGPVLSKEPGALADEYWNESAYYSLTSTEVDQLEQTTAELFEMCVAAGDSVIERGLWDAFAIPHSAVPKIVETWNAEPPSVYGRFDLGYTEARPAKLFEFNADTPTSLLEAAAIQWFWLQDVRPDADQWNSLHERLVAAWQRQRNGLGRTIHFAWSTSDESGEDLFNVAYLQETADQAGYETVRLALEDVGWNERRGFVDLDERKINTLFKLWPWEWLLAEEFGAHALEQMGEGGRRTTWIEPIYKMLWSNKALLAVLWELYPGHPNLLETRLDGPGLMKSYVRKPLLAREGANVTIVVDGHEVLSTPGEYGGPFVWQAFAPLPDLDGNHPVLGSWLVDGEPAGLGIRESDGLVTDNRSRFVPHAIE